MLIAFDLNGVFSLRYPVRRAPAKKPSATPAKRVIDLTTTEPNTSIDAAARDTPAASATPVASAAAAASAASAVDAEGNRIEFDKLYIPECFGETLNDRYNLLLEHYWA